MRQQQSHNVSSETTEILAALATGPVLLDLSQQKLVSGGAPKGGWELELAGEIDPAPKGGW